VHTGAAEICFCYIFIELSQNNTLDECKIVTVVESLRKMAVILIVMPCSLVQISSEEDTVSILRGELPSALYMEAVHTIEMLANVYKSVGSHIP
jgi:hypothetical protein